jgi:phosphoribosylanthranilate isomerase
MVSLARTINLADAKRILLAGNTIEDLCDETRQSIDCFKNQLKRASPECVQLYANHDLSSEKINDISSLRTLLCETEVIKAIRNNLDCILTMDMVKFGEKCQLPNRDMDCSQVESSEEYTARRECYSEKYSTDCNVETVLACGVTKVFNTCGEDASDLVALIGNAVFERFPICPAGGPHNHLAKMLKFFKK